VSCLRRKGPIGPFFIYGIPKVIARHFHRNAILFRSKAGARFFASLSLLRLKSGPAIHGRAFAALAAHPASPAQRDKGPADLFLFRFAPVARPSGPAPLCGAVQKSLQSIFDKPSGFKSRRVRDANN